MCRPWREQPAAGRGEVLLDRLAEDPRFPLDRDSLQALLADPLSFAGAAGAQTSAVVARVEKVVSRYPVAAAYSPGHVL